MTLRTCVIESFECTSAADGELFQAGSISKAVTALAALLLVGDGVLDLDRDVNDDLRSWRVPAEGVTIRRLLSHTSGMSVEFFPGYAREAPIPTTADVLGGRPPAANEPVRVDAAAAESFRYSGGGYVVVQALLADATSMSFANLAERLVLKPLGMLDSTFAQPLPESLHARAARGDWHVYPEAAAAGLWTTPTDLARFAIALQSALAGRPGPVPRDVAALMIEPQAAVPPTDDTEAIRSLGLAPPEQVGLGLFLAEDGRRFGHLGGAHGFTSAFDVSAVDGSGAVVMSDLHNGFDVVLPALAEALRTTVATP
jgi:CubicO group peptidase (beta-lactamase class C family)